MSAARNLEGNMEPLEVRKEEFEKVTVWPACPQFQSFKDF